MRWTKGALKALHEAAENYMVGLMEDANLLAIHTRQVTLQPRDIQLACRIQEEPTWMDNRICVNVMESLLVVLLSR